MNKRDSNYTLPLSGQIVGVVFDAMRIPYPVYLSKEMQRYFRGERIHDDNRRAILYLLADQLVERGIIPNTPVFDAAFLCAWALKHQIVRGVSEYAAEWDSLREKMSYLPVSRRVKADTLVTCLRLATIDLALRVASYRHLAKLPPLEVSIPFWAQRDGNSLFLKHLKDAYGGAGGLTNEKLADATGVINEKTVPGWIHGGRRPHPDHLRGLAELFASYDRKTNEDDLRRAMDRHYLLSDLCTGLANRVGRDRVDELIVALFRFAARLQAFFESNDPKPPEENHTHYLLGMIAGVSSSLTRQSIQHLWAAESDLEWKRDMVSVERDWVQRLIQKHLRSDQSAVRRYHSPAYMVSQSGRASATFDYQSARYEDNRIDAEMRLWGGAGDAAYDWSEKTEKQLRQAVARNPRNARCHLSLGIFLGMNELIPTDAPKGLRECAGAAELMPRWDLPRIEIAHLLMRAGRYDMAVEYLETAAQELGRVSSRLAYALGFARMMAGDMAGALAMYERIVALRPDYAPALDNAAYCAFKLDEKVKARDYAKRARLHGISTTYDMYDVGKAKDRPVPFPFPILCETFTCPQYSTCEDRLEAERGRDEWRSRWAAR